MRLRTIARHLTVFAATVIAPGGLCVSALADMHAARTVLTIHWGPEDSPTTGPLDAAIRKVLTHTEIPVDYFAEYLETEQFPAETASVSLRDFIRRKFEGRHIDVVIVTASGALQFALRYREDLFPGAPIVFVAEALPEAVGARAVPHITGVMNKSPFADTLQLALTLHPSARRVFVIARAPSVEWYEDRVRSTLSRFSGRVKLTYIDEPTVPALLAAVKAIPAQSVILYTRYAPDESSSTAYPNEIAYRVAEVSPVPIYTIDEGYIGSGVVGGMMRTAETTGRLVGEIAAQILHGTPPENIPIAGVPTSPIFDWRQVRRWGIAPSVLPSGSQILFRTSTAWETYNPYILSTIGVVTVQLALIGGLLTQRARRRRAEETLRAREASLRKSYDRIRQLAGRLINAQESARASIAQDLHDDICQRLAMVSTAIDRLTRSSGDIQDAYTQRFFAALARDTRGTFEAVRQLSHDLHPATLRVLGLVPAIKTHCSEVAKRHNVQVNFTSEGDLHYVPDDVAVCLFRIAQESLRNGVEHGAAHRLTVSLTRSRDGIEMTVSDDGRGFTTAAVGHDGVGVISMEDRARAIGGSLYIVSGAERGTTIRVYAPLKPTRHDGVLEKTTPADPATAVKLTRSYVGPL